MKKILSIIAVGGIVFAFYKAYQKAKSSKQEVKLVD
jgi:hypothetical protein